MVKVTQYFHSSTILILCYKLDCFARSLTRYFLGIFDIRQRKLLHTFQAHDSTIKCFAVDPSEEFFVSGSADGDIKVKVLANLSLYCL